MSTLPTIHTHRWKVAASIGLLLAVLVALIFGASMISGYGLNVRAFGRAALNAIQTVRFQSVVAASARDFRDVIFLHHSVGRNLIAQGNVREKLSEAGYHFWDHDYNYPGLTDPQGQLTGYSYNFPNDNTDPDGLYWLFMQPAYNLPINSLSALLQHNVIVFKSCFPASGVKSDAVLKQRKQWYLKMRDKMDQHLDKLFIVATSPPLNPAETNSQEATRARAFADWLKSDEYLQGHPNIVTFDLFDRLAEGKPQATDFNMLRQEYRAGTDSHPNQLGNETVGPIFAAFIAQAADRYRASRASN